MFQLHINLFSLTIGLGFDKFVLSFFAITKECFVFGVDRDIIILNCKEICGKYNLQRGRINIEIFFFLVDNLLFFH